MPEHEFERFLSLLSKLLKLSSRDTAAIADELCDHLETRYADLLAAGTPREQAVRMALDEFDDASALASRLTTIIRQQKRRRTMTGALGTAAAAAAIVLTTAFWPAQPHPAGAPQPASAADHREASAAPAKLRSGAPLMVSTGEFLPEGLRKPFPDDVRNIPVGEFVKQVQEITGISALIDAGRLQDFGISPSVTVSARAKDVPAWQVLDRVCRNVDGVVLDWTYRDGLVAVSTSEAVAGMPLMSIVDITPLLQKGYSADELATLIMRVTDGPWEARDGSGGTIENFDSILTCSTTFSGTLQVKAVVKALALDADVIWIDQAIGQKTAGEWLATPLTVDYQQLPLEAVVQDLEQKLGAPVTLDQQRLTEQGLTLDLPVTLSVSGVPLQRIISELTDTARLALMADSGELLLTTAEHAEEAMTTVIFNVGDWIGHESDEPQRSAQQLQNVVENTVQGPWLDKDGQGGMITAGRSNQLVIRQTAKCASAVAGLLDDYRGRLTAREPAPSEDPAAIEIRYYRLPEKTADDLMQTIPMFVAPSTWEGMNHSGVGLMKKVYVGGQVGIGGFGGGMGGGGLGGFGGGTGGGGFFQFGGAVGNSMKADGGLSMSSPMGGGGLSAMTWQPYTVLIIRQTHGVHQEIRKFINELFHGDANRSSGAPTPRDGLSWPSGIVWPVNEPGPGNKESAGNISKPLTGSRP